MKNRILTSIFIFGIVLGIFSCNEENENLVNPPSKNTSVYIRYVNLSADLSPRTLVLDKTMELEELTYGNISKAIRPPADSSMLKVRRYGIDEYAQSLPIKYFRNTNYTFYLISNKACTDCPTDTIITLRTTNSIPEDTYDAFVKVINAVPDSTVSYAVRMGCPSGEAIFANIPYKSAVTTSVQLLSGKIPVSVVRIKKNGRANIEEFVHLYELDVQAKGQYTLIFKKGEFEFEDLMILDELDTTINAIRPVKIVNERTTELRAINLSSVNTDIKKKGAESVAQNLNPNSISNYSVLSACQSKSRDSIEIYNNNQLSSIATGSLDVLERYSVVILDSLNKVAAKSYIIPPHKYRFQYSDKALVRVLHSNPTTGGLTVSLGARKSVLSSNSARKFSSGTVLCDNLLYEELSQVLAIEPGEAPIAIFTSGDPAQLVYAANGFLEAGKSYLLVVTSDINGVVESFLIEDNTTQQPIKPLERGVFVQYINAVADIKNVQVSLQGMNGKILEDAFIEYAGSIATVLPLGNNTIYVNGFEHNFIADTAKRLLLISTGKSSNIETFENLFTPLDLKSNNNKVRFRFINASSDANLINIKEFPADTMPTVESAYFKGSSNYMFDTKTKVISYYVFNDEVNEYIHRISDLMVTTGKSYAIIFAGLKSSNCVAKYDTKKFLEPNCYSVIVQQEF